MPAYRTTLLGFAVCVCVFGTAGCGDGIGTRYPVEGQVLVQGKPLVGMAGLVMFVPDRDQGNLVPVNATGEIDKDGRYKLVTKGREGAPAGWYKVVVNPLPPGAGDRDSVKVAPIHARFTVDKSTPLKIEVVATPAAGAYDLNTTRN